VVVWAVRPAGASAVVPALGLSVVVGGARAVVLLFLVEPAPFLGEALSSRVITSLSRSLYRARGSFFIAERAWSYVERLIMNCTPAAATRVSTKTKRRSDLGAYLGFEYFM
jgi:hypothetical protein